MLAIRIVLQILAVSLALVVALLDYKWHDKRTKKFRVARRALLVLSVVFLAAAVAQTILEDHERRREAGDLQGRLTRLQVSADNTDAAAALRSGEVSAALSRLQEQNAVLVARLAPFLALAQARYPSQSEAAALAAFAIEVQALQTRVRDLEARTAPRRIPPSSQANISMLLAPFRGVPVWLEIHGSHPEIRTFADQLIQALRDGGLTVTLKGFVESPDTPAEVHVAFEASANPHFLEALARALRIAGVQFTMRPGGTPPSQPVLIQVGPRAGGV